MARIDIAPELNAFVSAITSKSMYRGVPIPRSIIDQIEIEIRADGGGVLAPYWFSVLEHGRGRRKSNKDHGLVYIIEKWMRKRNMFTSKTPEGQFAEAKRMTWYINKYGNEQFRAGVFVDIYTTERGKTIDDIYAKYALTINKITMQII